MKSAEQIVAEAPNVTILEGETGKLALCCAACEWWTNDARKAKLDGEILKCPMPECSGFLRELPLEDLINTTKEENAQHFEAFIAAFSDNRQ